MAFVESKDGYDHDTFRANFYGGIWQITEQQYNSVKTCSGVLARPCQDIQTKFNIDWAHTQWKDLLKPLYSGLATYLYLLQRGQTLPGDVTSQENIWLQNFRQGILGQNVSFAEAARRVAVGCEKPTDLVFLVDESGSVGQNDFQKVREFLEKSINKLPIFPGQFRVSVVRFDDSPKVLFYLNAFSTSAQMVNLVKTMPYNGGGTNTGRGIDAVVNDVFSLANGAKPKEDAPRVLVLVTDGQSNSRALTVQAARRANQEAIEIFSVGVGGNVDRDELLQVSEKCNRVFSLSTFDDMDNFLYELIKNACGAKVSIEIPDTPNQPNSTDTGTVTKVSVPKNGTQVGVKVNPKGNGTTIVVQTNCSVVRIFGSYNDSNPSDSVFEITGTATDGRPLVLFVKADEHGRPLFLTFDANMVNSTQKVCFNGSNFHVKFTKDKPKVGEVMCVENGKLRNCTVVDIIGSKWSDKLCSPTDVIVGSANPCTPDKLRNKELKFAYPHDTSKYLKCDLTGKVYVITCPPGLRYHPIQQDCGVDHVSHPHRVMSPELSSLCTYDNTRQNFMYFPHPTSNTSYIQCDVWGRAWVIPCPDQSVWIDSLSRCESTVFTTVGPILNPCTRQEVSKGHVFYPYPHDNHRYIHCDDNANAWVQYCHPGKVFDLALHKCVAASGSHP
ncbi:uncharacterized protein LOC115221805 [Argonauta hians]